MYIISAAFTLCSLIHAMMGTELADGLA